MHSASPASPSSVEFRLLGETALPACLELQDRLWREMVATPERRIVVLVAEHPRSLTIGRQGSRAHIGLSDKQLNRRQLSPRWVSRGGGCVLHAPGQIAVYFVAPLQPLNL